MNKKTVLSIGGAILCGALAMVLVNHYLKTQRSELYRGMEMIPILVAGQDIPAGAKLRPEMLTSREIPRKYIHANSIDPGDHNLVVGQKSTHPLKQGSPVLWTDLEGEMDRRTLGGLSNLVPKGERALTISINDVEGVGGMLRPNDRVDILCNVRDQYSGEDSTLTLLQNMTILSVGQNFSSGRNASRYGNITLLVTLQEAELLIFAQKKGSLHCVLRNPDDIETHDSVPEVIFSDLVKKDYLKVVQKKRDQIEVIKRGKSESR